MRNDMSRIDPQVFNGQISGCGVTLENVPRGVASNQALRAYCRRTEANAHRVFL